MVSTFEPYIAPELGIAVSPEALSPAKQFVQPSSYGKSYMTSTVSVLPSAVEGITEYPSFSSAERIGSTVTVYSVFSRRPVM